MIKVIKHGNKSIIVNPVNGEETEMINVVFAEEGREGANAQMSGTSAFLDRISGETTGLSQLRVHTHPVRSNKIGFFAIGKTMPGHINRSMYSTPQIAQQENVSSRIIDGRPTYFTTYISDSPEEDRDLRMSNEVLMHVNPNGFLHSRVRGAEVRRVEVPNQLVESLAAHGNETLGS